MAGHLPDLEPEDWPPGFVHDPATGRWYRLIDGVAVWLDPRAVHPAGTLEVTPADLPPG